MKKVRDETLDDIIKYGIYRRNTLFYQWVCNICGRNFSRRRDLINHIIVEHLDDTLPDVDPGCPDYEPTDDAKYDDNIKLAKELLFKLHMLLKEAEEISKRNGW